MLRGRGGRTHLQHQTHLPSRLHMWLCTQQGHHQTQRAATQRHSEATNGNCSLNQRRGTQCVTQRSWQDYVCFYQRLTWLRERTQQAPTGTMEKNWNVLRFTQPSTTLRTAGCVISSYWMTLNKGRRSCDGCIQSFNRLTWTNNYPLQFRGNNQKKKKENESKCHTIHPILHLFKLLQIFLKLQYQVFIPLWSEALVADGRGQEMWPVGFNNKPYYSSTEIIEKFFFF